MKVHDESHIFGIDFGSSETMACRGALLAQRIVTAVLVSNPKQYWIDRLRDFLYVFQGEVTPFLGQVVGYQSCTDLFTALCELQTHLIDPNSPQPPHLLNRIEGFFRKTT